MHKVFVPVLTILAIYPVSVPAHSVNVYAYVQGNQIIVEGYFGGKAKVVNSAVRIYDDKEKILKEGQTDENGQFVADMKELPPNGSH